MEPTLRDGDLVILRKRTAKTGDVVVVRHPRLGRMVKRVTGGGGLAGDNKAQSTDTDRLGLLSDCELFGVAVLAITPAGLRRLPAKSDPHAGA